VYVPSAHVEQAIEPSGE